MSDLEKQKKRLRSYLNPTIQGSNTDAILESLAFGPLHLIQSVEAVNDNLYIAKAVGRFLDDLLAGYDITRPENIGLTDDDFRKLGIEVVNRKQIRDLIMSILRITYGEENTRATSDSTELPPYALSDGDNLLLQCDDGDIVEVIFNSGQFASIAAATAQEVANAITKSIRALGKTGSATIKEVDSGQIVQIISDTDGPASSVKVLGGSAQNILKFPSIRGTTNNSTTQWTLTFEADGKMRATWTGGQDPSIGKLRKNDYVNIFGVGFSSNNQGTFTINNVQPGISGSAFFEYSNPNGTAEVVVQGTNDAVLFYNPVRKTIISDINFAAAYQTESRVLEVIIPATTKVVRRDREGAAHLHDSGASTVDDRGPYIYDRTKPYIIGGEESSTSEEVNPSTSRIINVVDSTVFPDEEGHLVFGFGTEKEEGPIPYVARPSSNQLLIDPSYQFKNIHFTGTNISLIAENSVFDVDKDASDFPFYATDVVSGRLYTESLINLVTATGIKVVIIILYPGDEGLGKWGTDSSEKTYVWGGDL